MTSRVKFIGASLSLAFAAAAGCVATTVMQPDGEMASLARLTKGRSRCVSGENLTGEAGRAAMAVPTDPYVRNVNNASSHAMELGRGWKVNPFVYVDPGETFALMDAKGPGVIRHIWFTFLEPCTNAVLRMYWDDEESPSVEVPAADFFCQGWGEHAPIVSAAVCVNPAFAWNCYWAMPFRRHARITLENLSCKRIRIYYYIDYEETPVPGDAAYFHAQFRHTTDNPTSDFAILDGVRGRGHYVGTYLAYGVHNVGWWGEGEVKFFIDDDDTFPTICSTGLEDYFCGSHNFDRGHRYVPFLTPYAGLCQVLPADRIYENGQRFGMYRWHVRDPVRFSKRLKVTVQDLGWKNWGKNWVYNAQHSEVRATTFWYQAEPHAPFPGHEPAHDGIVRRVAASDLECEARQARLSRRASLADYRALVRTASGTNIWTAALQAALEANEIVEIPAAQEPYWIDGVVKIPSNRRIEAKGATVALLPGTRTLMLRNGNCPDGTLRPIAGRRDDNIAIVGGRWEDWMRKRAGYGATGRFDMSERKKGNMFGISTLFYFGNCDHVAVREVTFAHTSAFSVQAGDGDAHVYRDIVFDDCYADGLHLNGNLTRVHAKNVRGKVGDDLVALNAYDWLNSSVNFGPQRDMLCEDLELQLKDGEGYPAIRLQPAKYRYADGAIVDCAVSDVIFRRVKGIVTFKMYLQTPGYTVGHEPEWAAVGSGGNLWFEDISIDLSHPIDMMGQYATSDPVRGHFGAFEFGANLTSVNFRNIDIRFHLDKWPLSHLATVGPKSILLGNYEVFDPYVDCRVGRVTVEGLTVNGKRPQELVRATVFNDVDKDGRSSGRGSIANIEIR